MNDWIISNLGEVCDIKIGGTPSRNVELYWDQNQETDNSWVSIKDLSKRIIINTAEKISDLGVRHSNAKLFQKGTILLSFKLSIGRVAFAGMDLYTNEAIAGLTSEQIDPNYLYYGLQSWNLLKDVDQAIKGVTLNKEKLKKIVTLFPESKKEQVKIATILFIIDSAIEQAESIIAKHQRIKTGLMQDLLTKGIDDCGNIRSEATHEFKDSPFGRIPVEWDVVRIENRISNIIDYRGKTPKKSESGIPLITAKVVKLGYLDEPDEFISTDTYKKWMTRGFPKKGDVLFTTEAPLGNVAQIEGEMVALGQRILTIQTKPELLSEFLYYLLMDAPVRKQFELLSTGSTVTGIKQSQFRLIYIKLPEVIEQQMIIHVLSTLRDTYIQEMEKLKKLNLLKVGMMQDLLTGKVRVTKLLS